MEMQRSSMLILILLVFCSCGNSSVPTRENSASMKEVNQNASPTETMEAYLERFDTWFSEANTLITEGYEKASANVVLEEDEEWECDWEMDAKAIHAASRKAIRATDLLDPSLQKSWLSILDSADAQSGIYTIGTLMHMGKYEPNYFGDKTSGFFQEQSMQPTKGSNGEIASLWYPETICGGQAVTGRIAVKLREEKGKLLLVHAVYVLD
ncbi:MAG: hypothetical protein IPN95_26525 [Bacteroidetes bacterium]|nr:hypothetical protein [Bacteroidota bacterium]